MIILDGPVDGLEWFEAKNWKSMTFDYKIATSYLVLSLLLYILGLVTGPLDMYRVLRGSLQPSPPHPGGQGHEAAYLGSRGNDHDWMAKWIIPASSGLMNRRVLE